MIRSILFVLLLALPGVVAAQEFPALYRVTGVASDDVLNVRSGPGASHPIIGELAHDATDVEVVDRAEGANWGLVNSGERAGWVSLSFLERQPGDWAASPTAITGCFGTEPFWSVLDPNGTIELNNLGEPLFSAPADPLIVSPATGRLAISASSGDSFITVSVRRELCSDGMSDMAFGLSATVVSRLEGYGTQLWTGCCTVSR